LRAAGFRSASGAAAGADPGGVVAVIATGTPAGSRASTGLVGRFFATDDPAPAFVVIGVFARPSFTGAFARAFGAELAFAAGLRAGALRAAGGLVGGFFAAGFFVDAPGAERAFVAVRATLRRAAIEFPVRAVRRRASSVTCGKSAVASRCFGVGPWSPEHRERRPPKVGDCWQGYADHRQIATAWR
jgi:hypothetical protein